MTIDQSSHSDEEAARHARDTRMLVWILAGAGVFLLLWIGVVLLAFIA